MEQTIILKCEVRCFINNLSFVIKPKYSFLKFVMIDIWMIDPDPYLAAVLVGFI